MMRLIVLISDLHMIRVTHTLMLEIEEMPSSPVDETSQTTELKHIIPLFLSNLSSLSNNTHCPICKSQLPLPLDTNTIRITSLKPRFVKKIKKLYPNIVFAPSTRLCVKDLNAMLQSRTEELLQEDYSEFSKLQVTFDRIHSFIPSFHHSIIPSFHHSFIHSFHHSFIYFNIVGLDQKDKTMKHLGEHEIKETTWQNKFDCKRTFAERRADNVAKFGGSWRFVLT